MNSLTKYRGDHHRQKYATCAVAKRKPEKLQACRGPDLSGLHTTIQMKLIYSFSFNKQSVMIFMRNKQQQNQFKTVLALFDSY